MKEQHSFPCEILRLEDGMKHHTVPVPPEVAEAFEEKKIRRIILTIGEFSYRRAIQRKKDGRRYVVLGRPMLKETGLQEGSRVTVEIEEDIDPDFIEMGAEFTEALELDPEAKARWDTFPVGKRRSLALYVTSAKRVDTRIKRALDLAEKIRTYTLHDDKRPEEES